MQKKNKLDINYLCSSPEKIKIKDKFDVILNMEIIEHVEDINFFIKSCSKLLKKNGIMFVATLNKTLKSYVFAIIGAEYILRWLPIGTHDWEKFVKPNDLKRILNQNNLKLEKLDGMNFNLIKDEWSISKDTSINYITKFIKIDVEGYDHEVLKGMKKTIIKYNPIVLVEFNKNNFFIIKKFLKNYKPWVYFYEKNKFKVFNKNMIDKEISRTNKFNLMSIRNVFFIPKNHEWI